MECRKKWTTKYEEIKKKVKVEEKPDEESIEDYTVKRRKETQSIEILKRAKIIAIRHAQT